MTTTSGTEARFSPDLYPYLVSVLVDDEAIKEVPCANETAAMLNADRYERCLGMGYGISSVISMVRVSRWNGSVWEIEQETEY